VSTIVWIIGWAVVLGVVAFFAVREIRSGRKGPSEFDRTKHEAVRQASMDAQTHGPTNVGMYGP
jgi:hypothetical protein